MTEVKLEAKSQATQTAATGMMAWFSSLTNSDVLIYVTIVLMVTQLAYLIWKWRREARGQKFPPIDP